MKYFITAIVIFLFVSLIAIQFNTMVFSTNIQEQISALFDGSKYAHLNWYLSGISWLVCGNNWWDVFCHVGNGFIAFFNGIIVFINGIIFVIDMLYVFGQFIGKLFGIVAEFFRIMGTMLGFFFSHPLLSFVSIILFFLMFYDFLQYLRGRS